MNYVIEIVKENQDLKSQRYVVQLVAFFLSAGDVEKGVWECAFFPVVGGLLL